MMNLSKGTLNNLMATVITGSLVFCGGVASAATSDVDACQSFDLDQIVVTATRMDSKIIDTPANIFVVNENTIKERGYRNVTEVLEDVPGTIVKSNGFSGSEQHVYLNGEDRVLLLVNGNKINLARGGGHGRQNFDLRSLPTISSIAKIEVIKAASTTLYGSDAVGGVINIITKEPTKTSASLDLSTGSWGERNGSVNVSGVTKDGLGVFIAANKSLKDYTRYKDSKTGQTLKRENSEYDHRGLNIMLNKKVNDDKALSVSIDHNYTDSGQPYIAAIPKLNNRGTLRDTNVIAKYEWGLESGNVGYVKVARNDNKGTSFDGAIDSLYTEKKNSINVQQKFKTTENNTLIAGLEWNDSHVFNSKAFANEEKLITKAAYIYDIYEFEKDVTLNLGLRYDNNNYSGVETIGNIALNKKINDSANVYFTWNQIFNAPTGNDLFYSDPYSVGNPNLKPETGDVYAIGTNIQTSDSTTVSASYYRSKLEDAIDWAATPENPWVWSVYNIGKQKKDTFELTVKHELNDEFTVWSSYAYTKVRNSSDGIEFKTDPTDITNSYKLGFSYHKSKWNIDLIGRGASGLDETQYTDKNYLTVDLSLYCQATDQLATYIKFYNMTNAAYEESSGLTNGTASFPAAGRSCLVGMQYSF